MSGFGWGEVAAGAIEIGKVHRKASFDRSAAKKDRRFIKGETNDAQAFSAREAEKLRKWQEKMVGARS